MIKKLVIIFLFVFSGFTFQIYSQTNSEDARIFGVISTRDGAVISNVKIIIIGKNFRRETIGDMDGHYEIIVPPGTYDIIADKTPVFRKFKKKKVNINRMANFRFDIVLKFGEPIILD